MDKNTKTTTPLSEKDPRMKSVFITNTFFENCLIINVEAYDEMGYNAINTSVKQFDDFYDALNKYILDNFNKINSKTDKVRVCIYSAVYPTEYILTKDGLRF